MQRDIETLLEVQSLETRLKELDQEIASLPRRVSAVESRLTQSQQAVERTRAAQQGNLSERRQIERQIEAAQAKIAKSRGHSAEVKTNQEYRALMDEIAFGEAEISNLEEQLLQVMDRAEGFDRGLREAEEALAAGRVEIGGETKALSERAAVDKAEAQRIRQQRQQLRSSVDADLLRRFDRVLQLRGQAVASIDGAACGSCRVRLRPQVLQEISQQPERLFICESCGRILYMPAVPVEPVSSPL